ncbi:MAG: DNA polymerase I [Lachnospiraceae bacterium]
MSDKIVLVDGHSILNRAFYALPVMTNSKGVFTNAVYGFLTILFKTLEDETPGYLIVAFDEHGPTFRNDLYSEYKGTRKPMPHELREQVPLIREVLESMGIQMCSLPGFEADDILGTLAVEAQNEGMEVTVLSGDRDLLQLATDWIKIRIPKTKAGKPVIEEYFAKDVKEVYQLTPEQIIDLKSLMGDASDNIPGIPGVGEKTATKMLLEFQTLENAYEHLGEIKPPKAQNSLRDHYDKAKLSKELATICTTAPVELKPSTAVITDFYTQKAYEKFRELDFKNLMSRFETEAVPQTADTSVTVLGSLSEFKEKTERLATDQKVGMQLFAAGDTILYIAVALEGGDVYCLPVDATLQSELRESIQQLAQKVVIATLDAKILAAGAGISNKAEVFDVTLAAYLLNPLRSSYLYHELAGEYLEQMLPERTELIGKATYETAISEIPEKFSQLAACMAQVPLQLYEVLHRKQAESQMQQVFETIEMPLVWTIASMERWGIKVEASELQEYGDRLVTRITELEGIIYEQAGETFNIQSPKQLGVILFEKLKLPGAKKTKTGYSTAADLLLKLSEGNPIIKDILEYRQLTKLKSTYADGLAAYIGPDSRIHSHFNQTIAATGRISSTEPNLQNIPIRMELGRLIRKVFVPEEGFVFVDADYSQIELRVLAHMSEDETLIQAYKEAQDIHRLTASQVFNTPFDEVTSLQRRNAKAVNFGIVYGISSFGLSQDLDITRKEAAAYIESYFQTYPKIKQFLDSLVISAKETGYAVTLFGRRRPVPELVSSNFMQRSFGERVAMNSPIQGTAADIIKIAMNRVHDRLLREGLKSRLLLQVHDELLVEAHTQEVDAVTRILEEEMKAAADLSVSLEVDIHVGENWYEAK